jgi:hypothetical protein
MGAVLVVTCLAEVAGLAGVAAATELETASPRTATEAAAATRKRYEMVIRASITVYLQVTPT